MEANLQTHFAPAARARAEVVEKEYAALAANAMVGMLFEAVDSLVCVLNEQRQIVYMNRAFLSAIDKADVASVLGLRPGEALDCVHAGEEPNGCGTTQFCMHCGSAKAIVSSQGGAETREECRITQKATGKALDLLVHTTPLTFGEQKFTVFSCTDIGDTKRRQALEQTFFHDITNSAYSVKGVAELLRSVKPDEQERLRGILFMSASRLVDEIASQRTLLQAESGELRLSTSPVHSLNLVHDLATLFQEHNLAKDRQILVDPASSSVEFTTDRGLLTRVLGNMLKNALEASQRGEIVRVGCRKEMDQVAFWVQNPAVLSEAVRLQMFQRSFSTKGEGRGLGTYSMKLLTENYLDGRVELDSSNKRGTVFTVRLPMTL